MQVCYKWMRSDVKPEGFNPGFPELEADFGVNKVVLFCVFIRFWA